VSSRDNRPVVEKVNLFGEFTGRLDVAGALGSTDAAMYLYDVPSGGSSSPYHYEYVEEWLLVVDGAVAVRTPAGELALERGDLVRFPAGPDGAHKVMNRGDATARVLLFSKVDVPAVSVYPDSDKIGIWADAGEEGSFFKRGSAVEWAAGEDGWDSAG
jgi:uncharacterized cupin superfamily protein